LLLVSDVHGAFDDLARVAARGETLLVLGDLINLMDYRTGEGITAEVLGLETARTIARSRALGDFAAMRAMWRTGVGERYEEHRREFDAAVLRQYQATREALVGARAFVTYGNVDRPSLLAAHLPEGVTFVDGSVHEIEGVRIGFVGGGVSTPLGAEGEVTDEEMAAKLAAIGEVDVLCSHLPPAVEPLHRDVVTGRLERASRPILEYLSDVQPRAHFFGDVHQPQATTWRVGRTVCTNVGYFRATRRAVPFDPAA
jgi:Icc-related predicted phosphoesterase